jgi:hypothetical protein
MAQSYGEDVTGHRNLDVNPNIVKGHWSLAEDSELKREWLAKLSVHEISLLHNRDKGIILERMRILDLI